MRSIYLLHTERSKNRLSVQRSACIIIASARAKFIYFIKLNSVCYKSILLNLLIITCGGTLQCILCIMLLLYVIMLLLFVFCFYGFVGLLLYVFIYIVL